MNAERQNPMATRAVLVKKISSRKSAKLF